MAESAAPSLAVQIVLFRHEPAAVVRLLRSLDRAVSRARADGRVAGVTFLVGDSSPSPVLTPSHVDQAREVLRAGEEELQYHFFEANRGSAGGNNDLFVLSQSDLVLVINPDCYASPSLLTRLFVAMEDQQVGIAEGRQVPLEHPKQFDRQNGDTSWASGACMLIRRSALGHVGGFDESSFFMYCDDVDFSWRTRLAGFRVVYVPSAGVYHDKRLDAAGQIVAGEAEVYYSAEAALMMAWKWSRPDELARRCREFEESGSDPHRRAVTAFRARRSAGDLPEPIDPEGMVAQFVGDDYAESRFLYRAG